MSESHTFSLCEAPCLRHRGRQLMNTKQSIVLIKEKLSSINQPNDALY